MNNTILIVCQRWRYKSGIYVPIDGGDDATLRKWRGIVVLPEAAMRLWPFMRLVESVVESGNEEKQVSEASRDLV